MIQRIQNAGNVADKKRALRRLQVIDRSLVTKHEEYMKIENKVLRKSLITQIQECKERSNQVIVQLKSIQNLSSLSNVEIAKLNNCAYKGLHTNNRFTKIIASASLANEGIYEKLEKQCIDIVSKFNFKKIKGDNQEIIKEVGDCTYSCLNAAEVLEDVDCMCIGLSINRP